MSYTSVNRTKNRGQILEQGLGIIITEDNKIKYDNNLIYTKSEVNQQIDNSSVAPADLQNYYTKQHIDDNHYTKFEVDANTLTPSQVVTTINTNLQDYYDKSYIDSNLYTKSEIDTEFSNYYDKTTIDADFYDTVTIDNNFYDKTTIDQDFYDKTTIDQNFYTKTIIDQNHFTKPEINTKLNDYYETSEVDDKIDLNSWQFKSYETEDIRDFWSFNGSFSNNEVQSEVSGGHILKIQSDATQTLSNDLRLYYTFDETNPNAFADALGNYNGTNNGGTIVNGKLNNGVKFSDTEFIDIGGALDVGMNDFSLSFWFYPETDSVGQVLLSTNHDDVPRIDFNYLVTGEFGINHRRSGDGNLVQRTTGTTYPLQTWHHAVYTRTGENIKIYVNGTEEISAVIWDNEAVSDGPNGTISRDLNSIKQGGIIDEVGVWDRVLTASEVSDLYNNGSALPLNNIVSEFLQNSDGLRVNAFRQVEDVYLEEPNDLSMIQNLTVSLWVKPKTLFNDQTYFLWIGDSADNSIENKQIFIRYDKITQSIRIAGNNALQTNTAITENVWSHLALVLNRDKNTLTFYLNAEEQLNITGLEATNGTTLRIGGGYIDNGDIVGTSETIFDKVVLFTQALKDYDIQNLYRVRGQFQLDKIPLATLHTKEDINNNHYTKSAVDTKFLQTDGSNAMAGNLDMSSNRVTNVSNPTGVNDATNKAYVDAEIEAIDFGFASYEKTDIRDYWDFEAQFDLDRITSTTTNANQLQIKGSNSKVVLQDQLRAYWTMDDGKSDQTGNYTLQPIDSTNQPTAGLDTVGGIQNNAMVVFGTFTYEVGNVFQFNTQPFTINLWVNSEDVPEGQAGHDENQIVFTNGLTGTDRRMFLRINTNDTLLFSTSSDGSNFTSFTTADTIGRGLWHMITIIRNGSTGELYIDGSLSKSATVDSGDLDTPDKGYLSGFDQFYGEIDEVGVWDKVLTTDDINYLYNSGNGRTWSPDLSLDSFHSNSGLSGKAFQADSELYLEEVNDLSAVDRYSVSVWIYPTNFVDDISYLVWVGDGNETSMTNKQLFVRYDKTTDEIQIAGNSVTTVTQPISLNEWTHLVLIRDKSHDNVHLYLNTEKVLEISGLESSSGDTLRLNGGHLNAGEVVGKSNVLYDQLLVYTVALKQRDVNEIFDLRETFTIDSLGFPDYYTKTESDNRYYLNTEMIPTVLRMFSSGNQSVTIPDNDFASYTKDITGLPQYTYHCQIEIIVWNVDTTLNDRVYVRLYIDDDGFVTHNNPVLNKDNAEGMLISSGNASIDSAGGKFSFYHYFPVTTNSTNNLLFTLEVINSSGSQTNLDFELKCSFFPINVIFL